MKRLSQITLSMLTLAVVCGGLLRPAGAISRDEVMVRAKAYAYHPWTCTTANLTATCDSGYQSEYVPGDYMGLPYDWGGYKTLFQFDQEIAQGHGAGSYPADGVLSCTSGLDCSGYVSKCWDAGHNTTSSMNDISSIIAQASLLPGDALNTPGYHVVLFSHLLGTGEPVLYEAVGYNTHINTNGGWSYVSGYDPIRYDNITGTTVGNPLGTPENPIVIGSFPYSDSRNTSQSMSDVLDGCGSSPNTDESGPEYIYQVTFTQPGQLTVSVSDDVGVDIDVHLYTSMNTSDCIARHDSSFTQAVDCGTYYIVADTYQAYTGAYQLSVDFTPTGGGCGSGPPTYDFEGELGDECAYSGNPNLPFCNENFGSETCIYTTSPPSSFCSRSCGSMADCGAFPGGCCEDIGSNEFYCLPTSLCDNPTAPDAGVPDSGVNPTDGGVIVGPDSSTTYPDGGGPNPDGSIVLPDGGSTPNAKHSGCHTSPAPGGGPLLGLLLILLLALRRRFR